MDKTHIDIVSLFARMAPEVILAMDEGQYDGKVPTFLCWQSYENFLGYLNKNIIYWLGN